jgi:hypothetical protein
MKTLSLLLILSVFSVFSFAQNVQITPTGITPAPSGGAAMPRISYDAIQALPSPQQGDMAYDNTYKCLRYYNGVKWIKLLNSQDTPNPSEISLTNSGTVSSYISVRNIKTDPTGNIYISGTFSSNSGTGVASIGGINLTIGSGLNGFVAKFSSAGLVQWAQGINFISFFDNLIHMEVDPNGAVYVAINMNNILTIGSFTFNSTNSNNVIFAKYSTLGVLQYAKQITGTNVFCKGLCLDAAGLPYLTGYFSGSSTFGTTSITSSGGNDVFIAKYTAIGNLATLIKGGGASSDEAVEDIIVDNNGEIYVTGSYSNGSSLFGTNFLPAPSVNNYNMFLAKYTTITNSWDWVKNSTGLNSNAIGTKLAIDNNNGIYVFGQYWGTVSFNGYFDIANQGGQGGFDLFVAKYSNSSLSWVNSFGSPSYNDLPLDIVGDSENNITFISKMDSPGNIGGIVASGYVISKIDNSGNFIWTNKSNYERQCLTKSTTGNIYIGGRFSGFATIGVSNLTAQSFSPLALGVDLFISKMVDK